MAATGQQKSLFEDYDGFVEKFKPKKTTDDCYTPANIYEVVAEYVAARYGIDRGDMVRPFWPEGDYERFAYPKGCCVVDNPPFSICAQILRFYQSAGIRFFLFSQYLTAGSTIKRNPGCTIICAPCSVRYENGAEVPTCFITNMEPENAIRSDPELLDALNAANDANLKTVKKQLPKYDYPDEVLTVSKVGWFAIHHTPYVLKSTDCAMIDALDSQRSVGKSVFGAAFLLSERAAAERAAAERAAAERAAAVKWQLSDRERLMQKMIESKTHPERSNLNDDPKGHPSSPVPLE